jgi:hypothetical protein
MATVTPARPSLAAIADAVVADATAQQIAALTAQVTALTNIVASLAVAPVVAAEPRTRKAKPTPKPRPKATHGDKVTDADTTRYSKLWRERLTIRKTLGLTSWTDDEASTDPRMVKVVTAMTKLRNKGVNPFLLAPAK